MRVNVLGTDYGITRLNYSEDKSFEKQGICGYCDWVAKKIVFCNIATYPGYEEETKEHCIEVEKQTLRHEITHAFLAESGMQNNSHVPDSGWATNEEMVDWIALQFPKMLKVFQETNCL